MQITLTLSPSEFVDRYLICTIRSARLRSSNPKVAAQAAEWVAAHKPVFDQLFRAFEALEQSRQDLERVHQRLWLLEDQIRSASLDSDAFGELSRQILSFNDERHLLKVKIDEICETPSAGVRVYGFHK